jgi:hypothetical protein
VVALIVAPLLPIFLLIFSTGQVLPVVVLVENYPAALAIGVPLYLLMRLGNKTRLRHFLVFSFWLFGFLSFAATAQSYRDTSETRPGVVNLLYLSICGENGLKVSVNEQRWKIRSEQEVPGSQRDVNVFIRAADDNDEWREVAEELLMSFEQLWGERVRFRDGSSNLIPRPVRPFAEE